MVLAQMERYFYKHLLYVNAIIIHSDRNDTNIVDYMEKYYPKGFTYQEFAKDFTAKFFDPVQWADLFVKAGAK